MSNDLVVQLGAKLDQFSNDMSQAGDIADSAVSRIEQSFASLNPGISLGNIATGVALLAGGVTAGIAIVAALNKSLSDTADLAERAGLSLERIQQLKFGANSIGVSDSDFANGIDQFATNLENAKSKSNDLLRVFQANGISITDSNGKLKDTNTLITAGVDIIKRAPTIQDALQIGSFLGFSRQFSQSIKDSGDSFLQLAAQANAAGAVIDDATIDKAKIFTSEWAKASALWGANLRAALGDMLPLLNDAVNGATAVIYAIKTAYSFIQSIKDFAIAPKVDSASLNQLNNILAEYKDIQATLASGKALSPIQLFQGSNIQNSDHQITKESVDAAIANVNAEIAKRQKDVKHIQITTDSNASKNPGLKTTDNNDAVDDAINSLNKHNQAIQADADAVGKGAAALAEFRAQAQETAAIQKNGGTITVDQAAQFDKLKASAAAAAQALAEAQVKSTISRGQQTSLFTSEDLAIANQLKGIYGDDIPAAMASSYAASLRFNATIQQIGQLGQQVNSGFLVDFETQIRSGASAMQALQTAGVNALGKIADKLAQMAADNLWSSAFGGSSGGSILSIFGLGSSSGAAAQTASANTLANNTGGAFFGPGFANGTDNAPGGLALVGEHGPEIMNVPKGAQIIPNDILRNGGGGGATVNTGTSITIQGSADQATLVMMRQMLAQRDAELPGRVVSAVAAAQKQRRLK